MRLHQIADMDEVADAGAVGRQVVGAEHIDLPDAGPAAASHGHLEADASRSVSTDRCGPADRRLRR